MRKHIFLIAVLFCIVNCYARIEEPIVPELVDSLVLKAYSIDKPSATIAQYDSISKKSKPKAKVVVADPNETDLLIRMINSAVIDRSEPKKVLLKAIGSDEVTSDKYFYTLRIYCTNGSYRDLVVISCYFIIDDIIYTNDTCLVRLLPERILSWYFWQKMREGQVKRMITD